MEAHHIWWFSLGLLSGAAALYLGRLCTDLRYFVRRRRDQRRTEARLRAEHSRHPTPMGYPDRHCAPCQREWANGASSSEATPGTPSERRR